MGILLGQSEQRHIRKLPGRVRIEVYGLKRNLALAQQIMERLGRSEGIEMVSPCIDTGRLLLVFSEQKISVEEIIDKLRLIEVSALDNSLYNQTQITEQAYKEVAVTTIEGGNLASSNISHHPQMLTIPNLKTVSPNQKAQSGIKNTQLPLPLTLAVGGLGVLGIKQLFW